MNDTTETITVSVNAHYETGQHVKYQDQVWTVKDWTFDDGNASPTAVLQLYDFEDAAKQQAQKRANLQIQIARMLEDLEFSIKYELDAIIEVPELVVAS